MKNLNHWLAALENRTAQEIQLGLDRVLEVALKLGLQSPKCNVITVAGTNGKGSTVYALEQIYHTAGYKVGLYTSPHLIQFNERIRLNQQYITDEALCEAFAFIEAGRGEVLLTYFEMTTLAALWYFQQQDLDLIILEVGLGGRLDATNLIDPDLSIITTVDFDHQEFLGDTLQAIGYEKAGILRAGKPFIYADSNPPACINEVASKLQAPAYFYKKEYEVREQGDFWSLYLGQKVLTGLPRPKIHLKAAAAALTAVSILNKELPVLPQDQCLAMSQVFIPGRLQLCAENGIEVLYDVAHNPQAAQLLREHVFSKKQHKKAMKVYAVFSALKDKDILGLINPLKDCVDRWYPAQLECKRALSVVNLQSEFKKAELFVDICYTSPLLAFEAALQQAQAGDLIVVYGSFFTVGAVMAVRHNFLEQKEIQ